MRDRYLLIKPKLLAAMRKSKRKEVQSILMMMDDSEITDENGKL
jgi:hypothetical protein